MKASEIVTVSKLHKSVSPNKEANVNRHRMLAITDFLMVFLVTMFASMMIFLLLMMSTKFLAKVIHHLLLR